MPSGEFGRTRERVEELRRILESKDCEIDQLLAGDEKGGWLYELHSQSNRESHYAEAYRVPDAFVKKRANTYLWQMKGARQAYETRGGYKVLVKYEDLIADPLATMKRIYSALEIPVDEEVLARMVEKHSWENIPEDKKGEGKFHRKGATGAWSEDLTPEQVEMVEEITAPVLEEFYPS